MYEKIPERLKKLPQWVCWQAVPDENRPGKIKKLPINAKTGNAAKSNDATTWCEFEVAERASSKYSGLGFMFAEGYFGVDIDGAESEIESYKRGEDSGIIAEFIHTLQSYSEYSVSGRGIHIICEGKLPKGGRRKGNVEMYDSTRFFVMTGNRCASYDIRNASEEIKTLHEKYIGGGAAPTTGIKPIEKITLGEEEILKLARQSKQGQIFNDLFSGNWESYFTSQSEADMSLCNMLAFWTGRNAQTMDKLFRQSGLMREKWDRKQSGTTYGAITISKAIKSCINVYEPKPEYSINIKEKKPYKFYTFDDTGNAERFYDTFGENVLYNYTANKWMYFDGRKWAPDETGNAKRMADEIVEEVRYGLKDFMANLSADKDADDAKKAYMKHAKAIRSSGAKNAMLTEAQHLCPTQETSFDLDDDLLCVLNGTVNLATAELMEHNRSQMISKICPVEYTDKRDTPLWDKFLNEIFAGDEELIRFVQKACGYSLTGSTAEQCVFFCYGSGRNGKSTFIDTISEIMGDYAVNMQPETIMTKPSASSGHSSDLARLKGARFVTTAEPNEGVRVNEGLLKQLTGGDKVTAARKYENEFEFTPKFKLWMGTNHKPIIRGGDDGIWRRIRLIPFDVQIPIDKVDRQLKHKLKKELSGILAWMVEGCIMWRKEGLKMPKAVEMAGQEYKTEMDILSTFIDECCIKGGQVSSGELYKAYVEWAREGNEYEMSHTKFGREMAKKYEKIRTTGGQRIYIGVSLPEITQGIRVAY